MVAGRECARCLASSSLLAPDHLEESLALLGPLRVVWSDHSEESREDVVLRDNRHCRAGIVRHLDVYVQVPQGAGIEFVGTEAHHDRAAWQIETLDQLTDMAEEFSKGFDWQFVQARDVLVRCQHDVPAVVRVRKRVLPSPPVLALYDHDVSVGVEAVVVAERAFALADGVLHVGDLFWSSRVGDGAKVLAHNLPTLSGLLPRLFSGLDLVQILGYPTSI